MRNARSRRAEASQAPPAPGSEDVMHRAGGLPVTHPMDVLIVERDGLVAEVIADALADDGITATVVPDEQGALAIPAEEALRVVITGMNRSGEDMKGLAAARMLRARWPALGVIFMAALWPALLSRNALSGRDRFLSKPVKLTHMTHTVRELLCANSIYRQPG
jgi:CheY-like chemotaxis protein